MADIVLRDGSGATQTISDAKALAVDTVDGGIAVFVSEDAVPSNYEHPFTHPASMITGLVVGDVMQLPVEEMYFEKIDELNCCGAVVSGAWEYELGDSYTVSWDGTEYSCVVKDFSDVLPGVSDVHYLGNSTKFWGFGAGEDTGEPFCVHFTPDWRCLIYTDIVGPHTVGIAPAKTVRKLDAKYLPDGIATEEWVKKEIDKIDTSGGGSGSSGGASGMELNDFADVNYPELFAKQTVDWFTASDTYGGLYVAPVNFPESGNNIFILNSFSVSVGETYIVEWDGTEYEVVGQDGSAIMPGAVVLGNASNFGLSGNEEPFALGVVNGQGCTFMSITETVESHTIRIVQSKKVVTIKQECIPGLPFFDLSAMGLPDAPGDGTIVSIECDTGEIISAASKGVVKFRITNDVPIDLFVTFMRVGSIYIGSHFVMMSSSAFLIFTVMIEDETISVWCIGT